VARRTKAEAEATREALLDAAECVFMEQGVASAALEEVARRAGLTRGAIYWHFRNKVDLFNAMVDRVRLPLGNLISELQQQGEGDPIALLRNAIRLQLHTLISDERCRRVYTILYHRFEQTDEFVAANSERNMTLIRATHQTLCELFERAEHRGQLRAGATPAVVAMTVRLYLNGLYLDWLRDPERYDIELWGMRALDTILDGVVAAPATTRIATAATGEPS